MRQADAANRTTVNAAERDFPAAPITVSLYLFLFEEFMRSPKTLLTQTSLHTNKDPKPASGRMPVRTEPPALLLYNELMSMVTNHPICAFRNFRLS